jgi:dihydrofolate reductase
MGMGKLTAVEYLSLDGVMQSPGRPDEDTRGGFDLGGWAAEALGADPEAAQASMGSGDGTAALLFGRRTYDDLVRHWLSTAEPNPFTQILRDTRKYVASRDPDAVLPHPNSTLLSGDALAAVRDLKDEVEGDIVTLGSGDLVRQLTAAGLVDEYVVTTIPVVLGRGTRLWGETYASMTVVRSFTSSSGIVVATLRVQR